MAERKTTVRNPIQHWETSQLRQMLEKQLRCLLALVPRIKGYRGPSTARWLKFSQETYFQEEKKMSGQQGLGILSPSRNSQFWAQVLAGGKPSRWSAPAGIFPRAPPWKVPTEHWPGNSPHHQQTLGWLMAREASHWRSVEHKNPQIPSGQEEMVSVVEWQDISVQKVLNIFQSYKWNSPQFIGCVFTRPRVVPHTDGVVKWPAPCKKKMSSGEEEPQCCLGWGSGDRDRWVLGPCLWEEVLWSRMGTEGQGGETVLLALHS